MVSQVLGPSSEPLPGSMDPVNCDYVEAGPATEVTQSSGAEPTGVFLMNLGLIVAPYLPGLFDIEWIGSLD